MLMLALGLIFFFRYGPPLPTFLILVVAAIFFVLAASFFERYEVGSILWGFLASVIGTGMIVMISGGIRYLLEAKEVDMVEVAGEELISGMALCIIVSMALLNYLKKSLGEIEEY
jgi:hypothetical protein